MVVNLEMSMQSNMTLYKIQQSMQNYIMSALCEHEGEPALWKKDLCMLHDLTN